MMIANLKHCLVSNSQVCSMVFRTEHKDFEKVGSIDPITGALTVNFYNDGMLLPSIKLSGKNVKRISGLYIIENDLQNALQWYEKAEAIAQSANPDGVARFHLEDREAGDDVKAYFVASMIFYAKAFASAQGRGTSLSRTDLDQEYRETHDTLIAFRNGVAAHSGSEDLEQVTTSIVMVPSTIPCLNISIDGYQSDFAIIGDGEKSIANLIKHAWDRATTKRIKSCTFLLSRAHKLGIGFWAEKSRSNSPVDMDPWLR
jgi:hypothetical protein